MKDSLRDPRRVAAGIAAALLGVFTYCLVVAPIIKGGPYLRTALDTLGSVGWGMAAVFLLIGTIWVTIVAANQNSGTL